jgi:hypothetical protein
MSLPSRYLHHLGIDGSSKVNFGHAQKARSSSDQQRLGTEVDLICSGEFLRLSKSRLLYL